MSHNDTFQLDFQYFITELCGRDLWWKHIVTMLIDAVQIEKEISHMQRQMCAKLEENITDHTTKVGYSQWDLQNDTKEQIRFCFQHNSSSL